MDDTAALGSSFVLQPRERLVRDTLYSITIRKGLKDARGNATAEETVYKVRVDGKLAASPAIDRLPFRTNPEALPADAAYDKNGNNSDDYTGLAVTSLSFPAGGAWVDTYVDLYLRWLGRLGGFLLAYERVLHRRQQLLRIVLHRENAGLGFFRSSARGSSGRGVRADRARPAERERFRGRDFQGRGRLGGYRGQSHRRRLAPQPAQMKVG